MPTEMLEVLEAGHAAVQDLGRKRVSHLGVSANGAADEYSARMANVLVGNPQGAPLVEVLSSTFSFTTTTTTAVAVTGATADVTIDGRRAPGWASFRVTPGCVVTVREVRAGLRYYVAVGGTLQAARFLDSVAPDRALGFGTALAADDRVPFDARRARREIDSLLTSRLRPNYGDPWTLDACAGPEWDAFAHVRDDLLRADLVVHPQSNHVGTRLTGTLPSMAVPGELSSRGVAIGAVEITPSQELVLLHRGRSITAGYPVVLVVTAASLSMAGQLRPGDRVRFKHVTTDHATAAYRRQRALVDGLERSGSWTSL